MCSSDLGGEGEDGLYGWAGGPGQGVEDVAVQLGQARFGLGSPQRGAVGVRAGAVGLDDVLQRCRILAPHGAGQLTGA